MAGRVKTAVEYQLDVMKTKLRNEFETKLKRDISLNSLHPEPKTRDELVDEALLYITKQYLNRCASRQIGVATYDDPELIGLSQKYRDEEKAFFENKGVTVQRGAL